jgi:endogenous inhibitor of DNA gyrase (YacG/DUF329 family)
MKLILCKECGDIIRLIKEAERHCFCGKCSGQYKKDGLHAWYKGEYAIPLGIANSTLTHAVNRQPYLGEGEDMTLEFTAFVIPMICATFEKIDHES